MTYSLPSILLGAGGHARVICESFRGHIIGFLAPSKPDRFFLDQIDWLGDDSYLDSLDPTSVSLLNGIGSTGDASRRIAVFEKASAMGFVFPAVVHQTATVSDTVVLNQGVQLMAGSIVQANCKLGRNILLNTGAILDHDVEIGDHVHIASGATLSGGVRVGAGAHVGTGASVVQGVSIGERAIVGAGAVVVRDVPRNTVVVGVPARPIGV